MAEPAAHALQTPLLDAYHGDEQRTAAGLPPPPRPTRDPEAGGQAAVQEKNASRQETIGLLFNALSTVFGTGMSLFAKISGSQGIGVFEIVMTRSLLLVLFTGPELLYFRTNPFQDKRRRWLLVLRGVLGFCSVSSLYLAVALLPLADASVLSFLSPIFVAVLGPVVLKERSSIGVLLGIPVAMIGVVLVAQPSFLFGGSRGISGLGIAVGICQACFNALARICVRALSMGSNERMSSIIFGQGAISLLGAGMLCAVTKNFKVPTEAPVWGSLLVGGFLGYLYQLALTAGLQRARAAPAVAMSYLGVIWGIVADIFVFHDLPDNLSLVGAAVICCSSFFVAFSQKRKSSHKVADARWEQSALRLAQESEDEQIGGAGWQSLEEREALLRLNVLHGSPRPGMLDSPVKPAVRKRAVGEIEPPDTPAPPQQLTLPPAGQAGSSVDSLQLLGSSPGAPHNSGLAGGSPPAAR